MQQLQSDVISMVQDPRYSFFDFEGEFLKSGFSLLGRDNVSAITIFEMTAQMYPQSAQVWSALGVGYSKVGDVGKAIGHYEKALGLNPAADLTKHVKSRLEGLRER